MVIKVATIKVTGLVVSILLNLLTNVNLLPFFTKLLTASHSKGRLACVKYTLKCDTFKKYCFEELSVL